MARKIGRKLIVFVAAVTALQLYALNHYNSLLTSSDTGSPSTTTQTPSASDVSAELSKLRTQYRSIHVSPDQTTAACLDSQNKLHFVDLQSGKEMSTTVNDYPVQYITWIRNDSVFVGEQEAPGTLLLKRVQADSGSEQVLKPAFTGLTATARFTKIAYSAYTNDVYVLINTDASSRVYHIGTMSDRTRVPLSGRYIKTIALTEQGNKLYFEDYAEGTFNVLSYADGQVRLFKKNAALVGTAGNTMYYGDINQEGLVTTVYKADDNGNAQVVSTLPQPTLNSQIQLTQDGKVTVNASQAT